MFEQLGAIFTLNDTPFGRGVDRVIGWLNRLESRARQTGTAIDETMNRSSGSLGNLNRSAQSASGGVNSSFGSMLSSVGKFAGGLFAAQQAFDLFKQGLQITSDFERIDASLQAVSSSNIDFAKTQSFLLGLADSLGVSYEVLASSFKGLKAATNGTNLEGAETERIFQSVIRAGAALKLSNDDIRGTLTALTQMMSKGTVQAEELRGQLGERLPGAFRLMADALGVSTAELGKMLEAGEVMAADALPKLATELEKTYGAKAQANVNSMAGGFTRAMDQLKLFVAEFSKTAGIDSFFAKLGNGIADYLTGMREAQRRNESLLWLDKPRRVELTRQAQLRTEFTGANPARRAELLDTARRDVTAAKFRVQDPRLNADQQRDAAVQLTITEERLNVLRRENLKLIVADRAEGERAAKNTRTGGSAVDPIKLLEKAKDRFKYLSDLQAGLSLQGKDLSKEQAAELNRLDKQLQTAGVRKTPKTPGRTIAAKDTPVSTYDLLSKQLAILKEQARDIQLSNKAVPDDLFRRIESLTSLLAEADSLFRRVEIKGASELTIPSQVKTDGFKLPSLDKLEETRSPKTQINDQRAYFEQLVSGITRFKAPLKSQVDEVQAIFDQLVDGVAQTFSSAAPAGASAVGNFIGGLIAGTAGIEDFPKMILGVIGDTLRSLAATLAASGAALLFVPGMQAQGIAQLAGATGLYAAAALASSLAQPKQRKMAKGGLLYGPTSVLAGEYMGASNNPEVFAPLSDLKKELGGTGDSSYPSEIVIRAFGDELRGVLKRAERSRQTYG